ncbi:hypothetical protein E2C01_030006 [Portunus trituberculatus]|uniref:Uncharacterized protein n=1 Tax=Portunus trituberculatus TaxID=210409 RepID=A0A5B7EW50_PORTR|nr:hypothetical protein [Portunus trituberculatus]
MKLATFFVHESYVTVLWTSTAVEVKGSKLKLNVPIYYLATEPAALLLAPTTQPRPLALLTFPEHVVVWGLTLALPEAVKSEVGELEDEARVYDTVAGLEVAMCPKFAGVQEGHPLQKNRFFEGTKSRAIIYYVAIFYEALGIEKLESSFTCFYAGFPLASPHPIKVKTRKEQFPRPPDTSPNSVAEWGDSPV